MRANIRKQSRSFFAWCQYCWYDMSDGWCEWWWWVVAAGMPGNFSNQQSNFPYRTVRWRNASFRAPEHFLLSWLTGPLKIWQDWWELHQPSARRRDQWNYTVRTTKAARSSGVGSCLASFNSCFHYWGCSVEITGWTTVLYWKLVLPSPCQNIRRYAIICRRFCLSSTYCSSLFFYEV